MTDSPLNAQNGTSSQSDGQKCGQSNRIDTANIIVEFLTSNTKDAIRALECFLKGLDVFKVRSGNLGSRSFKFLGCLPVRQQ